MMDKLKIREKKYLAAVFYMHCHVLIFSLDQQITGIPL